jgi:hypothetical protein
MNTVGKNIKMAVVLAWLAALVTSQWATAGSLYEYYTTAPVTTLQSETKEMGQQLSRAFVQNGIHARQQRIDFAEYYTNVRKLVLYATRLSAYSEYEKDLVFARDNEVFKGLPDESTSRGEIGAQFDRKDFVKKKYTKMKKNVEEEIETYVDLIHLSLDACETLMRNDLSGFGENNHYRERITDFKQGKEFREYVAKRNRLTGMWGSLEARISHQFALWDPKPVSPDDPLINRTITEAI